MGSNIIKMEVFMNIMELNTKTLLPLTLLSVLTLCFTFFGSTHICAVGEQEAAAGTITAVSREKTVVVNGRECKIGALTQEDAGLLKEMLDLEQKAALLTKTEAETKKLTTEIKKLENENYAIVMSNRGIIWSWVKIPFYLIIGGITIYFFQDQIITITKEFGPIVSQKITEIIGMVSLIFAKGAAMATKDAIVNAASTTATATSNLWSNTVAPKLTDVVIYGLSPAMKSYCWITTGNTIC